MRIFLKNMRLNSNVISLVALVVSTLSATFSFVQSRISSAQLRLNEQQLRPYVKDIPAFLPSKDHLGIDMILENYSPLPARVLHTQLTAWVGADHVGIDFHTTGPDLLYQHKGGISSLPPVRGALFRTLERNEAKFSIGVCVVYASTAKNDSRVWLHQALYEYVPGSSLPLTRFIDEENVDPTTSKCVAKEIEKHLLREPAASSAKGRTK